MDVIGLRKVTDDGLIDETLLARSLIVPEAYDEATGVYLCSDGTLGFAFLCYGLSGGDESTYGHLEQLLKQDYPAGSTMQFCLYKSADIESVLANYKNLRDGQQDELMREFVMNRVKFLRKHTREDIRLKDSHGMTVDVGKVSDTKLIVSFKLPLQNTASAKDATVGKAKGLLNELASLFASEPENEDPMGIRAEGQAAADEGPGADAMFQQDLLAARDWKERIKSLLATVPLYPVEIEPAQYIRILETMVNWSDDAVWRHHVYGEWDQGRAIHDQIFDPTTDVVAVDNSTVRLGESCYVKTLSAKRMPDVTFFGEAIGFIGDILRGDEKLNCNYMVVSNVHFPDVLSVKNGILRKHQWTTQQAFGPMLKFVPLLSEKKKSMDILYDDLQKGNRPLQVSHTVVLFARTYSQAVAEAVRAASCWETYHYSIREDKFVTLPVFKNCLPLCTDRVAVEALKRYKTMTSAEAPAVLPVFAEWKGSGTPYLELLSRNGQVMNVSLHDTNSNMNAFVAAASGSGKSFLLNAIIIAYLSQGAQVWVIDAGKSYKKACNLLNGDFLQFGENDDIRLNPFSMIENWQSQQDSMAELIKLMAFPNQNSDNVQTAELVRMLTVLWERYGNKLNIDLIAEECLASDDNRVRDMGTQLFSFTSKGPYGRYFNRENSVSFKKNFTVLELDELQGRKHLRQVVLMQLIYQIQHDMFLSNMRNLGRTKLLIIDEAWDLLSDGPVAKFMGLAYRRFRKYKGSAIIATQSINDLYDNEYGRAIAENSNTKFLLGQHSETIENVRQSKKLDYSEGMYTMLKSVHTKTGVYSEIFVDNATYGKGVGRLIVSPFEQLAFSTRAEDVQALNDLQAQGYSIKDAINKLLRDRGYAED